MVLPGLYSVIVPLPSVVVVVVVVSETCAHANGAATAKTMLSSILFIVLFIPFGSFTHRANAHANSFPRCRKALPGLVYPVIEHQASSGCKRCSNRPDRFAASYISTWDQTPYIHQN